MHPTLDSLSRDLRFALRALGKSPLFATVAVLTLALGIGVNATIFTFVNTLLLAPPPIERPDEVLAVYSSWEEETWATSSYSDYLDLRRHNEVFAGICGGSMAIASWQHDGRSEVLIGELVTGDFFEVLGVEPARGRGLMPIDDQPGAPRTVVLGHGLWQRHFAGDPGVLGWVMRFNGENYEVVGVAPQSFPGMTPGLASDFWVAAAHLGEIEPAGQINAVSGDPGNTRLERRGYRWMWLRGRLSPGVAAERAEAQLAAVMGRLAGEHPLTNDGVGVRVRPIGEVRIHPDIDAVVGSAGTVLMGAVGLVLLVVCANLANLLLARAQGRRREIAIRLALGAGRGRLVRQLVTESLVLATLGGALAVFFAQWTTRLLLAFQPPIPFSVNLELGVDGRVVLFTALLALGSTLLFALVPALQASRPALVPALKEGAGEGSGRPRFLSLRNALVMAQVAVSTVLLIAAALLLRAVDRAHSIDLGFDAGRVAAIAMNLDMHGYEGAAAESFYATLRQRARALPGVEEVALAQRVPLDINLNFQSIFPEVLELDEGHPGFSVDVTWVDPEYFATLGVESLAGRGFTSADDPDAPRVAIVNRALARRFWADGGAVGQRFRYGRLGSRPVEIVGVVEDYKVRTVGEAPRPMLHYVRAQKPVGNAYLLARTTGSDASALVAELRRITLELDPEIALAESTTLAGMSAVSLFPVRMGAALLGAFGLLALILASVGLYGVIATAVSQRYRELGVRMALGARPGDVARLVVVGGMVLVAAGAGLGVVLAATASRFLSGVLYGLSGLDPLSYLAALLALATVAFLANSVPASRASKLDIVKVLRSE